MPFDDIQFELVKPDPCGIIRDCILLSETRISGFMFNDDPESLLDGLHLGDELELEREPRNPYDYHAIRILDKYGNRIGYIPRRYNTVIANLMDAGKEIYCLLTNIVPYQDEPDIFVMVLMREQY